MFLNSLGPLFRDYGYSIFDGGGAGDTVPYHLGTEILRETVALASPPNEVQERTLSLSELIPDGRPGLYKLGLSLPGDYRRRNALGPARTSAWWPSRRAPGFWSGPRP